MDIGRELQALRKHLEKVERAARLSHAAIDNTAVQVKDGNGSLRGIIGVQADGTTAVNIVNGTAPPIPSTPTVAPALGGVAVGWDGTVADGSVLPMDWSRVEVHTSATTGFTPTPETLRATIETPQGGICYVPATSPTYACLLARNTSGTASNPTPVVGPYSPKPVAGEIGIGEITETMISDGAVTTPKLFANAVTTPKLAAGSVDATAIAADAITGKTITGGQINGAVITGGTVQTGTSGEHITLNELNQNKILLYNSSNVAVNELSARGLLVQGTNGAVLWLNPNATYPQLKLYNAANSNNALVQVSQSNPGATGDANLEMISGRFSGSGFSDMCWHTLAMNDSYAIERVRFNDATTIIGGRVLLGSSGGTFAFKNTADSTQDTSLVVEANLAHLDNGRLQVLPPASTSSALYVNPATGHTGNLLRLAINAVDKTTVDKDGNIATAGNATVSGNLTVTGIGQRVTKRRTSDLPRSNTATAAADPQITFTVDANSVYVIDGYLKYSGASDILIGWTVPTGTNGEWQGLGNGIVVISGTNTGGTQQDQSSTWGYALRTESTDIANTRTYGGIGTTPFGIQIRGLIRVGSTGGTFALAWSQGASSATATILYTDSHVRIEKVA
ncbi:hypothetical protein [Streptomyces olivaceoviridis]|uniref:hypothetical protein n=1 Tax=Streptomyces olivaceoviridis TaxID=1921 RepID=UPI0036B3744A